MSKYRFLKLTTLFYAALTLGTLLGSLLLTGRLVPAPLRASWQDAAIAFAATGVLIAALWLLTRLELPFLQRIHAKLAAFKPLLLSLTQTERIYISLWAGISEELLFRGLLQPGLGILAASLIFGALHALTWGYFILATLVGFFLGALFLATDNLLVPMAVHTLYDVFALNLLAWLYARETPSAEDNHIQDAGG
ncbi:CPBP family intramembrane glutamic endopeptidase [Geoalkalibacter halelectricus]|uniref:CPBP family intramembrane metalloprotease n=1 Tax=Geoalkalibacter halelectricus TaxID=2847045 RepID=A0ABY5ZQH2_9BACT|nr:CPBP family intramembrane glutamic endopeptidase [Geoalkalibacter halelectricus]MDO3377495.1 CPBP family intramembrane metalloprotease [Geoalkalibacter halelectricus]UWZ80744.1 CPBP family intramembrane metalloprotease [Geoalkalibacter halelectricus]